MSKMRFVTVSMPTLIIAGLMPALLISVISNANAAPQRITKTSESTVVDVCGKPDGCLNCDKGGTCTEFTCKGKSCKIITDPPPKAASSLKGGRTGLSTTSGAVAHGSSSRSRH